MNQDDAKVFVVEDDAAVGRSLQRLLQSAGYRVELFTSAEDFLRREIDRGNACVVLDVQLPKLSGLDLQMLLGRENHGVPIVFISGRADIPMSVRAMKSGAVDFLPKPVESGALLKAVAQALDKARLARNEREEAAEIRRCLDTLTPREREVLCQVVSGALNKQIAMTLGISEKTVKVHRGRVMEKMLVQSLADLVRVALLAGIPAGRHKSSERSV